MIVVYMLVVLRSFSIYRILIQLQLLDSILLLQFLSFTTSRFVHAFHLLIIPHLCLFFTIFYVLALFLLDNASSIASLKCSDEDPFLVLVAKGFAPTNREWFS